MLQTVGYISFSKSLFLPRMGSGVGTGDWKEDALALTQHSSSLQSYGQVEEAEMPLQVSVLVLWLVPVKLSMNWKSRTCASIVCSWPFSPLLYSHWFCLAG